MSSKPPESSSPPSELNADQVETETGFADDPAPPSGPFKLPPEFAALPAAVTPIAAMRKEESDRVPAPTAAPPSPQPEPMPVEDRGSPEPPVAAPESRAPNPTSTEMPTPTVPAARSSTPPAAVGALAVAALAVFGGLAIWASIGSDAPSAAAPSPDPEPVVAPVVDAEPQPAEEPAPAEPEPEPQPEPVVAEPAGERAWEELEGRITQAYGARLGQWRDRDPESPGEPEVILMVRTDGYEPRDLVLQTPDEAHTAELPGKMMPVNERLGSTVEARGGRLSMQVFVPVYTPISTTITERWTLDGEVLRNRPYEVDPSFCYGLRTTLNTSLDTIPAGGATLHLALLAEGHEAPLDERRWTVMPPTEGQ